MNSYKAALRIDPSVRLRGNTYPAVTAIKLLRSFTKLSLREAKDMIDDARNKDSATIITVILTAEQLGNYHALVNHGGPLGENDDCYNIYPNDLITLSEITPHTDTTAPRDLRQ